VHLVSINAIQHQGWILDRTLTGQSRSETSIPSGAMQPINPKDHTRSQDPIPDFHSLLEIGVVPLISVGCVL
jgi:hypothetical protein